MVNNPPPTEKLRARVVFSSSVGVDEAGGARQRLEGVQPRRADAGPRPKEGFSITIYCLLEPFCSKHFRDRKTGNSEASFSLCEDCQKKQFYI